MITTAYACLMAAYNRWQNENLYAAADTLDDTARKQERGAFFGSIHGTLNHLLWADQIWMHRFSGSAAPRVGSIAESSTLIPDWTVLKAERQAFDHVIIDWAVALDPADLEGNLTRFSGSINADLTRPLAPLIVHMFNHGTHHRGQVHAMLTQAGVKPGDTDMPLMPDQ